MNILLHLLEYCHVIKKFDIEITRRIQKYIPSHSLIINANIFFVKSKYCDVKVYSVISSYKSNTLSLMK